MKISIIIPTFKRFNLLRQCIQSIIEQKHNFELQIIVCINGEDDESYQSLINEFSMLNNLEIYRINPVTPAQARNYCFQYADGSYIHYLDDDTIVPLNFYANLEKFLKLHQEADIVGGPDLAPANSNFSQIAFALALMSPFCSGSTYRRHTISSKNIIAATEKNLTLANLIVRKSFMQKNNLEFNAKYFRNEENKLLLESQKIGAQMFYNPELFIYHYRREKISNSLRGVLFSGYYRTRLVFDEGFKKQWPFLVLPFLFIGSNLYFFLKFDFSTLFIISLYALVSYISSLYLCFTQKQLDKIILVWPLHYLFPLYFSMGVVRKFLSVPFSFFKDKRVS